jgi:hypothetical protein
MNIWKEICDNRHRYVCTYRDFPNYGLAYAKTCEDDVPEDGIYQQHGNANFWFDRYDVKVSCKHDYTAYIDFTEKLCFTHSFPSRHCTLHISNQFSDYWSGYDLFDIDYHYTILDNFLTSLHPDSYCFVQLHTKAMTDDVTRFQKSTDFYKEYLPKFNNVLEFKIAQEVHQITDNDPTTNVSDNEFNLVEYWKR